MFPVLVADRGSERRALIGEALNWGGYPVQFAADGLAVLQRLAEAETPVVAVLGADLPELDGYQLLQLFALKPGAGARYGVVLLASDIAELLGRIGPRADAADNPLSVHVVFPPYSVGMVLLAVRQAAKALTQAVSPRSQEQVGERYFPRG